ncbi:hydrolase [Verticillium alfalfae VaMs.102]|uniref:Hydrolase n=1 Tax=Verticillium alfalfae (strain VaMs.102 / ATCC MYA-4576 / FGSC 10136) TaxID=526221 RepID=C9SX46_VERA1|nr:hydrolase [Verticillium alfalfae VaMs.102]EEY23236.1 hydrolase [Verticillium alfalfae VaMs.102]
MNMATETEGTFTIDGKELYTKTWTPQGPVKAKLVFVHGFSDHVNRYYGLFPSLAARGIQVHGFDQRGWGRSVRVPADKGLTGPTAQVIADVAAFTRSVLAAEPSTVPVFVMGNSMGGGQVATLASHPAYEDLVGSIRGFVLEAPFIAFPAGEAPSAIKTFLGKLASRGPEVVKSVREDPLCHDTGTLEGLAGLLERTDALASGRVRLGRQVRSLFLAHGTGDKTTSWEASRKWFDAQGLQDGRYKEYEGCYHQLHADLCKDEFYSDVGDWILERTEDRPGPKL